MSMTHRHEANDPPTLADLEVLRAKVNELILAARR